MELLYLLLGLVIGCVGTIIGYHSAMRSLTAPRKGWERYANENGLPIGGYQPRKGSDPGPPPGAE